MARKRTIDTERLEADYRAGSMSVVEIAKVHGCTESYVRKVAKLRGWERDLTARVRQIAAAKLAADAPLSPEGERQAVEDAADVRVQVVRGHRKHIARLQRIVENLHVAIERQSEALAEIVPTDDMDKITAALMTPHQIAQTTQKLADTQAKLIAMERQAFSISDDAAPPEKPYEDRLRELVEESDQ